MLNRQSRIHMLLLSNENWNTLGNYKAVIDYTTLYDCITGAPPLHTTISRVLLRSFDVTKKGHSSKDPVVWAKRRLQIHCRYISEVCSPWFLVNGTFVHTGIASSRDIYGIYMHNRHRLKQNLWFRFYQLAASSIPSCVLQIETVYVDALLRWSSDVVFEALCDVIV